MPNYMWLDQPALKRLRPPPAEVELGIVTQDDDVAPTAKHYLLGPKLGAKSPSSPQLRPTTAHQRDQHSAAHMPHFSRPTLYSSNLAAGILH